MTIVSSFPIILLILAGSYCLIKSLKADHLLSHAVQNHNTSLNYSQSSLNWKQRLDTLTSRPSFELASNFIKNIVEPALEELKTEMTAKSLNVVIQKKKGQSVSLIIKNDEVDDFIYRVALRSFEVPSYCSNESDYYYRAEVFLLNGSQEYDIYSYSKEQILGDIMTQFERHYHYLHLSNSTIWEPAAKA